MNNTIFGAFSVRFVLDFATRAVVFVITIIVARKLNVDEYGQFTYALSLANLFYVFTELGMHLLILREVGDSPEKLRENWRAFLGLKLALGIGTLIISCVVFPFVWPWRFSVVLLSSIGWMLGNSFFDFLQSICNSLHRFRLAGMIALFYRGSLVLAVAALFALHEVTVASLLILFLCCNVAASVVSARLVSVSLSLPPVLPPTIPRMKKLLRESIPIGLANILGMVYQRFDMLFLGWMATSAAVGYYGAAYRIYEIVFMIPGSLMAIAMPMLSRARSEGAGAVRAQFKKINLILTAIALVWLAVGFFGAGPIINLVFGSRYSDAAPLLKLLAIANITVFASHVLTYTLIVFGRQKRHAANQAACFVFSLVATYAGIHFFGARGAALSIIMTQLLLCVLTWLPLRPLLEDAK